MSAGNSPHRFGGWRIIEEHTSATIHLEINETRGKDCALRQPLLWPIFGNLSPARKATDTLCLDEDGSPFMPSTAVEHSISQNGATMWAGHYIRLLGHMPPFRGINAP